MKTSSCYWRCPVWSSLVQLEKIPVDLHHCLLQRTSEKLIHQFNKQLLSTAPLKLMAVQRWETCRGSTAEAGCPCLLSCVQLFAALCTVALQAPLPMGFPRQEYWSRLLFLTPGDLSDPVIEPASPVSLVLAVGSLPLCHPRLGADDNVCREGGKDQGGVIRKESWSSQRPGADLEW